MGGDRGLDLEDQLEPALGWPVAAADPGGAELCSFAPVGVSPLAPSEDLFEAFGWPDDVVIKRQLSELRAWRGKRGCGDPAGAARSGSVAHRGSLRYSRARLPIAPNAATISAVPDRAPLKRSTKWSCRQVPTRPGRLAQGNHRGSSKPQPSTLANSPSISRWPMSHL